MATKKAATKESGRKAVPATKKGAPGGMPKGGKDPKGGLTAEGRRYFAEKEGLHLRPGVKGKADTPEKMLRKGSFLRRHFANPQGPVKDKDGEPTRQALEAAAWGEPVPQSAADERKLAAKGKKLLEQYHAAKDSGAAGKKTAAAKKEGSTKAAPAKKTASQKASGTKTAAKKSPAKKTSAKKPAKKKASA